MNLIRVEYDAYNRIFKVLDPPMARGLEDGHTYLIMDFSAKNVAADELNEVVEANLQNA